MNLRDLAFLAGLLASAAPPAAGADADIDRPALPVVLLVATGGTIAGVQNVADDPDRYRAGSLSAEQVIESVPKLKEYARIETLQFSNVPSALITPAMWIDLSRRIEAVLKQRDEVAGVVVTHGTDRLEETAFFLYLTVRSDKPVVLVGAQRPATGLSPDGPQNLLDAVRTAVAPGAVGKGVMVAMDGRILSAREVRKLYQRVGGFSTGDMGMLGLISHAGAEFFFAPTRPHSENHCLRSVDQLRYRKFKRPFLAVCRVGCGRAGAGLGKDRTCASALRHHVGAQPSRPWPFLTESTHRVKRAPAGSSPHLMAVGFRGWGRGHPLAASDRTHRQPTREAVGKLARVHVCRLASHEPPGSREQNCASDNQSLYTPPETRVCATCTHFGFLAMHSPKVSTGQRNVCVKWAYA